MAKLPTRDSLGPLPQVATRRNLAQLSTQTGASPSMRGPAAMARGISDIGDGIAAIGRAAEAYRAHELKQQEFDTERKYQEFEFSQQQALEERKRSTEPGKARDFADTWQKDYVESGKQFFKEVPEPLKAHYEQRLFRTERDLYSSAATWGRAEQKRAGEQGIVDTTNNVYLPRAKMTPTGDLDKVTGDFDRLVDANPDLTPIEKDELKRKGRASIARTHLDALPPDQAHGVINSRVGAAAQTVTDKIIMSESGGRTNAQNPNSSAAGPGQFINDTWLDLVKRNRPDVAEGRTDSEILSLRTDPKYAALNREMVDVYGAENAKRLQSAGLQATPGNIHLAHFLGAGDAVKVLSANPSTPVSEIVRAKSFNANRSIMDGRTAGDLVAWSDKKMTGALPSAFKALGENDWAQAQSHADTRARAARVDTEHQLVLQQKEAKRVSDEVEGEWLKSIYANDPKATAAALADDKRLEVAARERMIKLLEHVGRADRTAATYGSEFYKLFQRIHAPDGDPDKISDPAVLYEHVKPGGGLTLSGMEKLRTEMSGKRTPEGEAEAMLKRQFFANAKGQISGHNEGLGIRDPKGEDLYLRFMTQSLADYEKGKKEGKSTSQLLNPESPDYVGKSIASFKRPMSQWFADTIADAPAAKSAPAFDPAGLKSLDELVQAHRTGRVSAQQARSIAVERGWAKARPEPIARPEVPMSR